MSVGPIMIMAGGTGGHVFPGLAVAAELKEREHPVVWLGTRKGLEARLVPEAGIDMEWITVSGLRGKGIGAWLAAPLGVGGALLQALGALRRRRPSAVLGLGGFVAGPGGIAAWLTGRPLLIHEQNAVAGTTNRYLARFARRVFEAFPGSFPKSVRAELVGNPVRRSISDLPPPRARFASRAGMRPHILVLGGSQGARTLNRVVPQGIGALAEAQRPEVWHQTGTGDADEARRHYSALGVHARVDAFIADMAEAYAWADLAICRAGALTVAELAAAGLGAILVPYPYAVDDHQTKNAAHSVERGAALVVSDDELDAHWLARTLQTLLSEPGRLLAMAERAREQATTDAAARLANACIELAEERR